MLHVNVDIKLDEFDLNLSVDFPQRGISAIFGPSGSGKTTLLRCIAGLSKCQGQIRMGEEVWLDSPNNINLSTHRRPVGYVFQEDHLFSHLDVAGNLKFAQRRALGEQRFSGDTVTDMLELKHLMHRNIDDLSGGERQRVAIARTLLSQPELLLLDEPLSAVDVGRKAELLPYLQRVCNELEIPALFVSHAIDEVAQLASHIAVIDSGRLEAMGTAVEILEHPKLQNLAGRLDAGVALNAEVTGYNTEFQLAELLCEQQKLMLPTPTPASTGSQLKIYVRARDVSVATTPPTMTSVRNIMQCKVMNISVDTNTPFAELSLALGQQLLHARITRAAVAELSLQAGDEVYAMVKSVSFDRDN